MRDASRRETRDHGLRPKEVQAADIGHFCVSVGKRANCSRNNQLRALKPC